MTTSQKINTLHPRYRENVLKWEKIHDCIEGENAVKGKRELYLPKPNKLDTSPENEARYLQYLNRAVFFNSTSRTLKGLVGMVFSKPTTIEIPTELEIMNESDDGLTLEQQAKVLLEEVVSVGRGGLLVDFPQVDNVLTKADLAGVKPIIAFYSSECIINWKTTVINGRKMLSLVVLAETRERDDNDEFEQETETVYRVLILRDGIYYSELYRGEGQSFELIESTTPLDSTGTPLTEIPFVFCGSENNDETVDEAPLYDLATLNIAHYRNSADYEESCFIVGQPTPYLTNLSRNWIDTVFNGGVEFGSRSAILLPEGATAGLLQAQPNMLAFEAMGHKEKLMIAIGARLIEKAEVQRTATEISADSVGQNSILANTANNVSDAMVQALQHALKFLTNRDAEIVFELNTDFDSNNLSPQEITALVSLWNSDLVTFEEIRKILKDGQLAYEEDDVAQTQIEERNPMLQATPFDFSQTKTPVE